MIHESPKKEIVKLLPGNNAANFRGLRGYFCGRPVYVDPFAVRFDVKVASDSADPCRADCRANYVRPCDAKILAAGAAQRAAHFEDDSRAE